MTDINSSGYDNNDSNYTDSDEYYNDNSQTGGSLSPGSAGLSSIKQNVLTSGVTPTGLMLTPTRKLSQASKSAKQPLAPQPSSATPSGPQSSSATPPSVNDSLRYIGVNQKELQKYITIGDNGTITNITVQEINRVFYILLNIIAQNRDLANTLLSKTESVKRATETNKTSFLDIITKHLQSNTLFEKRQHILNFKCYRATLNTINIIYSNNESEKAEQKTIDKYIEKAFELTAHTDDTHTINGIETNTVTYFRRVSQISNNNKKWNNIPTDTVNKKKLHTVSNNEITSSAYNSNISKSVTSNVSKIQKYINQCDIHQESYNIKHNELIRLFTILQMILKNITECIAIIKLLSSIKPIHSKSAAVVNILVKIPKNIFSDDNDINSLNTMISDLTNEFKTDTTRPSMGGGSNEGAASVEDRFIITAITEENTKSTFKFPKKHKEHFSDAKQIKITQDITNTKTTFIFKVLKYNENLHTLELDLKTKKRFDVEKFNNLDLKSQSLSINIDTLGINHKYRAGIMQSIANSVTSILQNSITHATSTDTFNEVPNNTVPSETIPFIVENKERIETILLRCYDLQALYLIKYFEIITLVKYIIYFYDIFIDCICVCNFIILLYELIDIDLETLPEYINTKKIVNNLKGMLDVQNKITTSMVNEHMPSGTGATTPAAAGSAAGSALAELEAEPAQEASNADMGFGLFNGGGALLSGGATHPTPATVVKDASSIVDKGTINIICSKIYHNDTIVHTDKIGSAKALHKLYVELYKVLQKQTDTVSRLKLPTDSNNKRFDSDDNKLSNAELLYSYSILYNKYVIPYIRQNFNTHSQKHITNARNAQPGYNVIKTDIIIQQLEKITKIFAEFDCKVGATNCKNINLFKKIDIINFLNGSPFYFNIDDDNILKEKKDRIYYLFKFYKLLFNAAKSGFTNNVLVDYKQMIAYVNNKLKQQYGGANTPLYDNKNNNNNNFDDVKKEVLTILDAANTAATQKAAFAATHIQLQNQFKQKHAQQQRAEQEAQQRAVAAQKAADEAAAKKAADEAAAKKAADEAAAKKAADEAAAQRAADEAAAQRAADEAAAKKAADEAAAAKKAADEAAAAVEQARLQQERLLQERLLQEKIRLEEQQREEQQQIAAQKAADEAAVKKAADEAAEAQKAAVETPDSVKDGYMKKFREERKMSLINVLVFVKHKLNNNDDNLQIILNNSDLQYNNSINNSINKSKISIRQDEIKILFVQAHTIDSLIKNFSNKVLIKVELIDEVLAIKSSGDSIINKIQTFPEVNKSRETQNIPKIVEHLQKKISFMYEIIGGAAKVFVRNRPYNTITHDSIQTINKANKQTLKIKDYYKKLEEYKHTTHNSIQYGGYSYDDIIKFKDSTNFTIEMSETCNTLSGKTDNAQYGPFAGIFTPNYNNFDVYGHMFGVNTVKEYVDDPSHIELDIVIPPPNKTTNHYTNTFNVRNTKYNLTKTLSEGRNVVLFGYGFSGSGKTYTLVEGSSKPTDNKSKLDEIVYDPSLLEQFINNNLESIFSIEFLELYPLGQGENNKVKIICGLGTPIDNHIHYTLADPENTVGREEYITDQLYNTILAPPPPPQAPPAATAATAAPAATAATAATAALTQSSVIFFDKISKKINDINIKRRAELRILATPNNNDSSRGYLQITINLKNDKIKDTILSKLVFFDMPGSENTVRITQEFLGVDTFRKIDELSSHIDTYIDILGPKKKSTDNKPISEYGKIPTYFDASDIKKNKDFSIFILKPRSVSDAVEPAQFKYFINNNDNTKLPDKTILKIMFKELIITKITYKNKSSSTGDLFHLSEEEIASCTEHITLFFNKQTCLSIFDVPPNIKIYFLIDEHFKDIVTNFLKTVIFQPSTENDEQLKKILGNQYDPYAIYYKYFKLTKTKTSKISQEDIHITETDLDKITEIYGITYEEEVKKRIPILKFAPFSLKKLTDLLHPLPLNFLGKKAKAEAEADAIMYNFDNITKEKNTDVMILLFIYLLGHALSGAQTNINNLNRILTLYVYKYVKFIINQGAAIVTTLEHLKYFFLSNINKIDEYNSNETAKAKAKTDGNTNNKAMTLYHNDAKNVETNMLDKPRIYTKSTKLIINDKSTISLEERVNFGEMSKYRLLSILQKLKNDKTDLKSYVDKTQPHILNLQKNTTQSNTLFIMLAHIKCYSGDVKQLNDLDIKDHELNPDLANTLNKICTAEFDTLEFAQSISSTTQGIPIPMKAAGATKGGSMFTKNKLNKLNKLNNSKFTKQSQHKFDFSSLYKKKHRTNKYRSNTIKQHSNNKNKSIFKYKSKKNT